MGVIWNDLEHGWQFATQKVFFYEDGQKLVKTMVLLTT